MTVAVTCTDCGGEVVFLIDAEGETQPRAKCDDCNQAYELRVAQIP